MAYGHGWTIHSHCPTKCHHFVNFLLVARWTTSGLPSSVSALIPLIRMGSNEPVNVVCMLSFQSSLCPAIAPGGGCPYARGYGRLAIGAFFPCRYANYTICRPIFQYKIINKNRSAYLCNLTRLTRRVIIVSRRIKCYENKKRSL